MRNYPVLLFISVFASLSSYAQKVNEKVQVDYNGTWHDATILKINSADGLYYITYDGWDSGWDEWVGISRVRNFSKESPKATSDKKWKVGDRCMVDYGMIPEPATIIEVGEENYHIQYDKKVFGTKWVKEVQIRKL